jgi:hypothetical protein
MPLYQITKKTSGMVTSVNIFCHDKVLGCPSSFLREKDLYQETDGTDCCTSKAILVLYLLRCRDGKLMLPKQLGKLMLPSIYI